MVSELQMTHAAFDLWIAGQGEDNRAELDRVKRIVPLILDECCTETEKRYIMHYFADQMKMKEIAEMYGLDRSSVSRGIRRGLDKAYKYLRFASPLFIKSPKVRSYLKNGRKKAKRSESFP